MIYYYYSYQNIIRTEYPLQKLGREDMTASDLIVSFTCKGMMPFLVEPISSLQKRIKYEWEKD